MRKPRMVTITVEYQSDDGIDERDQLIQAIAGQPESSGCFLGSPCQRDLDFRVRADQAREIMARIEAEVPGAKVWRQR